AVFTLRLGEAAADYWDLRPLVIEAVLSAHPEWCGKSGCDGLLAETLDTALAALARAYGPDIAQWQWGRAHVAHFANPVFSRIAAAIAGAVAKTPTIRAHSLSEMTGCEVYLKLETLHPTGSFKERGALNKLLSLGKAERRAGVVAMSAGNHAQGVGYHARRL